MERTITYHNTALDGSTYNAIVISSVVSEDATVYCDCTLPMSKDASAIRVSNIVLKLTGYYCHIAVSHR